MKLISPLLFVILILFIAFSHSSYQDAVLCIDLLESQVQEEHNEVHRLKNEVHNLQTTIKEQERHLLEQADIIDELSTLRNVRVTAYAPLDNQSGICAEGDARYTSIGLHVERGIVAVDPSKIPYGTKLNIPGYGNAIAGDTGGALRNYDGIAIDVLVDTYEEAMRWGVRYLDVTIK